MKRIYHIIALVAIAIMISGNIFAQENSKPVSEMTKEEISQLTYQDLLTLPLEDLIIAANKFGLSADEILEFFLNKDVTSASKRAEKSLNSPLSTTVISKEEIQNSGVTTIPEALRLVPGMIVRQKTMGNYDVHIRGNDNLPPKGMLVYSENSISLVMIDGRPVYNYAFGGTFWETLPIELNDIERIEVIRGPSSALYGPNAVSGAINLITRPVESNKLQVNGQVQLGNNNSRLANAAMSFGATNKVKIRLSGNYTHFDRTEDDFYVFDYGKSYGPEVMDTLRLPTGLLVEENFDKAFPDPSLATDKFGANAFINYTASDKMGFNLAVGTQHSEAISSALGNNAIPIVGRTSSTHYADLRANAYGFHVQTNYQTGDQDFQKQYAGFHEVPKVFNASVEYEYAAGSLVLRPGISYQKSVYNDDRWVDVSEKGGFLNGAQTLTSVAYYLRADYKLFEKLRLIAALRGDKYNEPAINKFTYQFITTFDINENNVVRAGYSRANRGSFMADTYADYYWKVVPGYYTMHYEGNRHMELPVMDMFEIGYRTKLFKNVLFEVEAFHSSLKDLTFFSPDQMIMYFDLTPITLGQAPPTAPYRIESHGQYRNLDLKSVQNGVTMNLSVVVNNQFNFRIFGTWQQSKLSNYYDRTIWDDFTHLQDGCTAQYMADLYKIGGGDYSPLANPLKEYNTNYETFRDSSKVSMTNEATPSIYGGLIIDYTFRKKLNLNSNFYFYTEQTFMHNEINDIGRYSDAYINNQDAYDPSLFANVYTIQPKFIMNLKVSYKFWKECSVFVNARNLLNDNKREFAYMDKVNGLYMLGMNFNF